MPDRPLSDNEGPHFARIPLRWKLVACRECGAVVADTEIARQLHERFHEKLRRAARNALGGAVFR